jgi:putative acetyltransferase
MNHSPNFHIRRAIPTDSDALFEIWFRSAAATHHFLTPDDLHTLAPQVQALGLANLDTWILCEAGPAPIGFLVMNGSEIDALFIAPEWIGRGGGSLLVRHARELHGPLRVEVNEQNDAGLAFYLARGFSIVSRSETDRDGRPFPLLHLAQ